MTSVADELALDAYLDSLDPMARASIERAMKSRYYDRSAVTRAYEDGYRDGQRDERASAKQRAADEAAKKAGGATS